MSIDGMGGQVPGAAPTSAPTPSPQPAPESAPLAAPSLPPPPARPSGLSRPQTVRLLALLGIFLALISVLCAWGEWHVVRSRRIIGSPVGDCAGRPCMEVVKETKSCRGSEHFGGLPLPLLLGALIIAAQVIILCTARRGLVLGLAITLLPLCLLGALLPPLTSIDHLLDETTLGSSGSAFLFVYLVMAGLAIGQIVLTSLNRPPPGTSPPSP